MSGPWLTSVYAELERRAGWTAGLSDLQQEAAVARLAETYGVAVADGWAGRPSIANDSSADQLIGVAVATGRQRAAEEEAARTGELSRAGQPAGSATVAFTAVPGTDPADMWQAPARQVQ